MSKRRSKYPRPKIGGQWVAHQVAMIRVLLGLSLPARRILDCLELQHCHHGGRENGRLVLTYSDIERLCNVSRRCIPRALRDLVSAGLIKIIRPGRRAVAGLRTPSFYQLTYEPTYVDGKPVEPTHDWKTRARPRGTQGHRPRAPRDTALGHPGTPEAPKAGAPRDTDVGVYWGTQGHSYLDLGEEGGGLRAGELGPSPSSPPAPSQEGMGPSASSPSLLSDDQPLPSVTAPSSGRLH
jgi:hypothetical protein